MTACLSTVPEHHPILEVMTQAINRSTHAKVQSQFPLAEILRLMGLCRPQALETIDPKPLAPWRGQTFVRIEIEPDSETATAKEKASARRVMPGITTCWSTAQGSKTCDSNYEGKLEAL
jgi:hypothetical protein